MNVLLVGEAPGREAGGHALSGAITRWARELDVHPSEFDSLMRRNLLQEWPGSAGKGSAFPIAEARRAAALVLAAHPWCCFLLVGKRVAQAFGFKQPPLLEWFWSESAWYAVVPHPSGVNRWYNDPANARAAAEFVLDAARAAGVKQDGETQAQESKAS